MSQIEFVDPNLHKGTGTFKFPNGDEYVGEYCAHRSGVVWREGIGTYTTKDGHIYKGEWIDDNLVETKNIEVTYPSGAEFYGCIVKNKYEGPGTYTFESKINLLCDFINNKPIGEISLIDIKGRQWRGVAGYDEALLVPEHIYFNNIHDSFGRGYRKSLPEKLIHQSEILGNSSVSSDDHQFKSILYTSRTKIFDHRKSKASKTNVHLKSSKSDQFKQSKIDIRKEQLLKEQEMKIFASTRKTASDLQFENSDWYKNYINFKTVYESIKEKIGKNEEHALEEDEKKWYGQYLKFKKTYCEIMNRRNNKNQRLSQEQLFGLVDNEEFKTSCPPEDVIYPTGDCDSICECKPRKENGQEIFD